MTKQVLQSILTDDQNDRVHTTFSCISLDAADEVYLLAAKWKEEFPYRSFGVMETFVK